MNPLAVSIEDDAILALIARHRVRLATGPDRIREDWIGSLGSPRAKEIARRVLASACDAGPVNEQSPPSEQADDPEVARFAERILRAI